MVPCCAHAHVALSQSSRERHFCLLPPIPRLLPAVVDAAVSNYVSRMLSAPHPIARAFTRSMRRRAVAGVIMVGRVYWVVVQVTAGFKVSC